MFESKNVVIIGGLGSIGSAIANHLADLKAKIIATTTDSNKLSTISHKNIKGYFLADAANFDDTDNLFAKIKEEYGRIDIVINCAGSIFLKSAHQTRYEDFVKTINTNLFTAFAVVRSATKIMSGQIDQDSGNNIGGSILLFSSVATKIGLANHEAISAAKSAINGLVISAAASYASKNIRINAIAPGLTNTKLALPITSNITALNISKAMHPLGRIGEISDIVNCATMLVDPQNSWITGQIISVDGGLSTIATKK
jgi:NAD(P)-dependent dehydrogenase (short-subunit alcohol dehydrogenase family)